MDSYENMQTRLQFNGGKQQERMNESKLKSLKKALLYSYQAATAVLADSREFRCLINPSKVKNNYDDKILSIPFKDICLNHTEHDKKTSEGEEDISIAPGDVFTWKENNTHWLVHLKHYEETAYFRADIKRCDYTVTIGDNQYYVYIRGPEETDIQWRKGNLEMYNELNYSVFMYITKNEETEEYFKRFKTLKINNKPWEVQVVDSISTQGIIEVSLKETFSNSIEEAVEIERNQEEKPKKDTRLFIDGPEIVFPYGEETYAIVGADNGRWTVSNNKAKIIDSNTNAVDIEIITGRSGEFILSYIDNNTDEEIVSLNVTIESL